MHIKPFYFSLEFIFTDCFAFLAKYTVLQFFTYSALSGTALCMYVCKYTLPIWTDCELRTRRGCLWKGLLRSGDTVPCTCTGEQPLQLVDSRIDLNGQILIAKDGHQYLHPFSYTVPTEIDFPRYNMKCSEENVILRGIFHVVSCFPLHCMLYRGNLDCFSNSVLCSPL